MIDSRLEQVDDRIREFIDMNLAGGQTGTEVKINQTADESGEAIATGLEDLPIPGIGFIGVGGLAKVAGKGIGKTAVKTAVKKEGKTITSDILERATIKGGGLTGVTKETQRIQEIHFRATGKKISAEEAATILAKKNQIVKSGWWKNLPASAKTAVGVAIFGTMWYGFEARGELGIGASMPKGTEDDINRELGNIRFDLSNGRISKEEATYRMNKALENMPSFERNPLMESVSSAGAQTADRRETLRKMIDETKRQIEEITNKPDEFKPNEEQRYNISDSSFREWLVSKKGVATDRIGKYIFEHPNARREYDSDPMRAVIQGRTEEEFRRNSPMSIESQKTAEAANYADVQMRRAKLEEIQKRQQDYQLPESLIEEAKKKKVKPLAIK